MAKQTKEKKVRIRILPLKGIGGVGDAGDTAWMTKEEADRWVKEGYVEILPDADEPVPSGAAGDSTEESEEQLELTEDQEDVVEEDHKIMKPKPKRD
ncbi:MAG: hypothetical protein EHM35_04010 [Planctomycetaceae bacterium]|nr:MAG: hypothetical protein EHM35_04010 [Planctomycetaceae bacterium]